MTRQKNDLSMELKMMNDSFFYVLAQAGQARTFGLKPVRQRNYVRAQAGQATTQLLVLISTLNELEDAC
jgi:hypothetical protein